MTDTPGAARSAGPPPPPEPLVKKPTRLIHWTPAVNLKSIMRDGLDPAKSRGALTAVWLCRSTLNWWAAAHVAVNHGVHPDRLVGLVIDTRSLPLKRTSNEGVYTSKEVIPPHLIRSVLSTSIRYTYPVERRGRSSDTVRLVTGSPRYREGSRNK